MTDALTEVVKGEMRQLLAEAKELGWDKQTLCNEGGIHRATFDRWLTGKFAPTRQRILALELAIAREREKQQPTSDKCCVAQ